MATFWGKFMSGLKGFREAYFNADASDVTEDSDWADVDARRMRYAVLWAMYEGNSQRQAVHKWATQYREVYGQYRFTRDLYNPTAVLADFYATHIWGGHLDPLAGNLLDTALPIMTANDLLRPAIARLHRDSNWDVKRNVTPKWGSVMGDVFLGVQDDPIHGKVAIRIFHPSHFTEVDKDDYGNIKGYTIEQKRTDPESKVREVTYREEVWREGDDVVYQLYRDNVPYAWGNEAAQWREPYTFVPMVHIQHEDDGAGWGMSAVGKKLGLFREIDNAISNIGDQVQKTVTPLILFSGMTRPTNPPNTSPTTNQYAQDVGRDNVQALYATQPDAKAQFLVANLDINAALDLVRLHMEQVERAYPELQLFRAMQEGNASTSGESLRRRQSQAAVKVQAIRQNYDSALMTVQQMAIAIGGWRGYDGYRGFNLDSYAKGDLEHSIAKRGVFARDPIDDLNEAKLRAEVVKMFVDAGGNITTAARLAGLTEEDALALVEVEYGTVTQ